MRWPWGEIFFMRHTEQTIFITLYAFKSSNRRPHSKLKSTYDWSLNLELSLHEYHCGFYASKITVAPLYVTAHAPSSYSKTVLKVEKSSN